MAYIIDIAIFGVIATIILIAGTLVAFASAGFAGVLVVFKSGSSSTSAIAAGTT